MRTDPTSIETVRANLRLSRDPRVPRTRAKIFDAVNELAAQGQASVSVGDIVRVAGISKTTFYHHFAGLDAVARELVSQAYADFGDSSRHAYAAAELSYADTTRAYFQRMVDHYVAYRPFYLSVLAMRLSREVHTLVVRAMAADIAPDIASNSRRPPEVQPPLAASLIASAVVGFFDEWLEGGFEAAPDDLLEHLLELLPPWFTGIRADRP